MNGIHIEWEGFSQSDWEEYMAKIPRSNSFQDWDFADLLAKEKNTAIERLIIKRKDKVIGLAQIFTLTYFGFFKQRKLIRGPLFLSPPMPDELEICFKLIKSKSKILKGQICTLMPELPDSPAVTEGLSKMGFSRIMTGYSSIWLDLRKKPEALRKALHGKWRNQLSKSEAIGFDVAINDEDDLNRLISHSQDHQSNKGFTSIPLQIYQALPVNKRLCMSAKLNGKTCAALLFQTHGKSATYQVSYANDLGKSNQATNFLLWQAILWLKENGYQSLDMGGIDVDKNPNLARFKERLGGESFTLTGSYI